MTPSRENSLKGYCTRRSLINLRLFASRRNFLHSISLAAMTSIFSKGQLSLAAQQATPRDSGPTNPTLEEKRIRALAAWTGLTLETPHPVPYGAEIVNSKSGERLMRATNAVATEHDPSAHAELRTIRLACNKLNSYSLEGHTLYTTCEPCAMCMACILWAGLDRVVYGATLADAARFGSQIFDSLNRDRKTIDYEMCCRRSSRARSLSRAVYKSQHAEGFQDSEFRQKMRCVPSGGFGETLRDQEFAKIQKG